MSNTDLAIVTLTFLFNISFYIKGESVNDIAIMYFKLAYLILYIWSVRFSLRVDMPWWLLMYIPLGSKVAVDMKSHTLQPSYTCIPSCDSH